MRNLIKIVILMSLFILISCTHPNYSCDTDSDCERKDNICVDGFCGLDPCEERRENICGKGKCIPGKLNDGKKYNSDYGVSYHCECHEDSVWFAERKLCLPTCSGYSEECTEFGKTTDFKQCNIEKGHCDTQCRGEGSCPNGYTCTKKCTKIID